ncbi:hypothetical protein [Nocardioides conyzicola]|uniref:Uncharacterized protein n=1 Tax=Nocardioides conyzicola TaxID=1651781 RepID=A0ABP8XEB6_9ACTN
MSGGGRMPSSAWAFAGLCVAGQLVQLAHRGLSRSDGVGVFLSMALTALVVSWFAAGVLRGRTVRLVIVWILIGLGTVLTGFGIVVDLSDANGWDLLDLLLSLGQVAALAAFCSTDYLRWQRAHPDQPGPGIGGLVAVALVVGLLGGMTASSDDGSSQIRLRVGL